MLPPFLPPSTALALHSTCPQLDNAVFAHLAPLEILFRRPRPPVPHTRYLPMIRHHQPRRLPYLQILLGNIAGHKLTAFECCEEETLYDRRARRVVAAHRT